jgi:hypothetical protein
MSFSVGPKSIDYNKSVEELLKMNPRDSKPLPPNVIRGIRE